MAVIGIDLGTTNSCAAVLSGGDPDVIVNSEGERLTPSVVAIGKEGERLIGHPAKRQAIVNPANTIYSCKRFIGRTLHIPQIGDVASQMAFEVVAAANGDCRFQIDGTAFSPEEVSAMILEKIRSEAEDLLGTEVDKAVITVPAYFDDRQRTATKDAGKIAGLEVLRIINEPTAAALAYGVQNRQDRVMAVYDLGGGTFDISILEQRDDDFRVLATSGDSYLGGDDFDQVIIDHLVRSFEESTGAELPVESTVIQRLKNAAENAKKDLSFSQSTQITIPFITAGPSGPLHLDVELLRAEYENLVRELVERTIIPCRSALQDSGLDPSDIDAVVLVGGQTRSPIVQKQVAEFFGKDPIKGINPDEAVALGAAVAAGVTSGDVESPPVTLRDVNPLSLGVETVGGMFTKLIPRNTAIPTSAKKVFTSTEDNQLIIRVHVLQGERELATDNRTLGIFDLVGVRPASKGIPQIEISFDIDEEGIVHVTARDQDTGRSQRIRITDAGGLSDGEIEQLVLDAQKHRQEDEAAKERVTLKNKVMELVYAGRRLLEDPDTYLEESSRQQLRDTLHEIEQRAQLSIEMDRVQQDHETMVELLRDLKYEG